MQPLTEEAFWYMVFGGLATVTFGVLWLRWGQRFLLIAAGVTLLITIGMGVFEAMVVTPREEVEIMLDEMAAHVQNNNIEGVLPYIHGTAKQTISRAKADLPRPMFERVAVTRIVEFEHEPDKTPPMATVEFLVSVKGDFGEGAKIDRPIVWAVTLNLLKEDDGWKVTNYSHRPPQKALMK